MDPAQWMHQWLRTASPLRATIFGPPGSGKGTHGSVLAERHRVPYIDTGSILRAEVAKDTALGRSVRYYMETGNLAPDSITVQLVLDRLANDGQPLIGFVLDGFPRTVSQAVALDYWAASEGVPLDAAIYLDVPEDELMERLLARGRADDTRSVIEHRFEVYHEETAPMVDYYDSTGDLLHIGADATPAEVARRIEAGLSMMVGRGAHI